MMDLQATKNTLMANGNANNSCGQNKEFYIIRTASLLSHSERKLSMFFKCCHFGQNCYWTGDRSEDFVCHLKNKHPEEEFFCVYCHNPGDDNKRTWKDPQDLTNHIIYDHPFRMFQCSLCLYRGSNLNSVKAHIRSSHSKLKGIYKIFVCKQVVYGPRPLIERESIQDASTSIPCSSTKEVPPQKTSVQNSTSVKPDTPSPFPTFEKALTSGDSTKTLIKNSRSMHKVKEKVDIKEQILLDLQSEFDEPEEIVQKTVESTKPADVSGFATKTDDHRKDGLNSTKGRAPSKAEKRPDVPAKNFSRNDGQTMVMNDSTETNDESLGVKRKRAAKWDHSNLSVNLLGSKPVATSSDQRVFKCILCDPPVEFKKAKISWHCKSFHFTDCTTKCKKCSFVGSKTEINDHFAEVHVNDPHEGPKYTNFVIASHPSEELSFVTPNDTEFKKPSTSTLQLQEKARNYLQNKAKRSNNVAKKSVQNPLMLNIKKKPFVGPSSWGSDTMNQSSSSVPTVSHAASSSSTKTVLTTTIERVDLPKTSSKKSQVHGAERKKELKLQKLLELNKNRPDYFCFFCPETQDDGEKALKHMKKHLSFGYQCGHCNFKDTDLKNLEAHSKKEHKGAQIAFKDDETQKRNLVNWIIDFLNGQFKYSLFEPLDDEDDSDELQKPHIECILCKRAAELNDRRPLPITSFQKFSEHFKRHTRWYRVDCTICGATVTRTEKINHLQKLHPNQVTKDPQPFLHRECELVDKCIAAELTTQETEFWKKVIVFNGCTDEVHIKALLPKSQIQRLQNEIPVNESVVVVDLDEDEETLSMKILAEGLSSEDGLLSNSTITDNVEDHVKKEPNEDALIEIPTERTDFIETSTDQSNLDVKSIKPATKSSTSTSKSHVYTPASTSAVGNKVSVIEVENSIRVASETQSGAKNDFTISKAVDSSSIIAEVNPILAADEKRKAFTQTLTDDLRYGCGHCCTSEARFSSRKLWRLHHQAYHQGSSRFLIVRPSTGGTGRL